MSALLAEAAHPRATIVVAIHGGSTMSAHFNCPGHLGHLHLRVTVVAQLKDFGYRHMATTALVSTETLHRPSPETVNSRYSLVSPRRM